MIVNSLFRGNTAVNYEFGHGPESILLSLEAEDSKDVRAIREIFGVLENVLPEGTLRLDDDPSHRILFTLQPKA